MSKAYLLVNEQRINLTYDDTTIGRLSSNLIAIPDPTISKAHASISFVSTDSKFYLRDLSTVNGTYVNGSRLEPNKRHPLKHKDCIQFGKHANLYYFYQAQPEHEKKGKINLKDYCFELDSDIEPQQLKPSTLTSKPNAAKQQPQPQQNTNKTASNVNQPKKLKIPNLADYLLMEDSMQSSEGQQSIVQKKGQSRYARQGKISLPKIDNEFDEQDLSKVRKQEQNRRNLFLSKQAQRMAREESARAMQEQKIRLQIQKYKQEEEMLRRQVELQRKLKAEQERMEQDKKRIEEELVRNQQQRRQKEQQMEQQQRLREQQFVQQMKQEKEAELEQIRNQEQSLRSKAETAMREQLERKKKDLEMQAQALAEQYEQIYRDTIKKMKNDIEKEQTEIEGLQNATAALRQENSQLEGKVEQVAEGVDFARQELAQIAGRNKAFILYASELQNKLDKIKADKVETKDSKISQKLKEEVLNSRKLLAMKKKESIALENQVNNLKVSLNLDSRFSSDVLDTIISNHQSIQKSKVIYFEYLREQKALKQIWAADLEQNQQLQQQNLSLEKEIGNSKRQLVSNLRENASRMTEQRLHMLKCLHYLPEEKKRAAKFLIEEMVTMEEEIRTLVGESEASHDKIHSLIVDSERKKQQNEYLSELLFGADSTAHHFDNMKIQINHLIEKIGAERDEGRVARRMKVAEDIENNQIRIYEKSVALQKLGHQWKEGLPSQKIVLAQKNPIVFFGDLLTKRELEMQGSQDRILKLEHECSGLLTEVEQLQRRKQQLADSLQKFKRDELSRVRQSLL